MINLDSIYTGASQLFHTAVYDVDGVTPITPDSCVCSVWDSDNTLVVDGAAGEVGEGYAQYNWSGSEEADSFRAVLTVSVSEGVTQIESYAITVLAIPPESGLPVSLETVKTYLRVDGTADDVLITSLIISAAEKGEEISRRAFLTQTRTQVFDEWPRNLVLKLWGPPLRSVTSVEYLDSDNVAHLWTDYVVDNRSAQGRILFNSLPGAALQVSGAITVTYVCGFGQEADLPARIKTTILQLVAYWYQTRELGEVPAGIQKAFLGERVVWF